MGNKSFKGGGHTLGTTDTTTKQQKDQARARALAARHKPGKSTKSTKPATTVSRTKPSKPAKPSKRQQMPPTMTAQQKTTGRTAAALAAESRAGAWDKKVQQGKSKRRKEQREINDRYNQQQGTASASARAAHSNMSAVTQPTVNLQGFDPTQAVFRSSAQATSTMTASQLSNSSTTTSTTTSSPSLTSSSSSSSSSTGSAFSSTLVGHHVPVDQAELARMMPLLQTSTVKQRNATNNAASTAPPPLSNGMLQTLQEIFDNQAETPDLDFACARLMSHANAQEATKACELISKIIGNIIANPTNVKFHTLKLSSKAVLKTIVPVSGAMDVLAAAGFGLDMNTRVIAYRPEQEGNADKLQSAAERIMLELSTHN